MPQRASYNTVNCSEQKKNQYTTKEKKKIAPSRNFTFLAKCKILFLKILLFLPDAARSLQSAATETKICWKQSDSNPPTVLKASLRQCHRIQGTADSLQFLTGTSSWFCLFIFTGKIEKSKSSHGVTKLCQQVTSNLCIAYKLCLPQDCLIYLPGKFSSKLVLSRGYRKRPHFPSPKDSDWLGIGKDHA